MPKESSPKEKAILKAKEEFSAFLSQQLREEHGLELGCFEAEELFDQAMEIIAPILYNQGLHDAKDHMLERLQVASEDIIQLEINPAPKRRK